MYFSIVITEGAGRNKNHTLHNLILISGNSSKLRALHMNNCTFRIKNLLSVYSFVIVVFVNLIDRNTKINPQSLNTKINEQPSNNTKRNGHQFGLKLRAWIGARIKGLPFWPWPTVWTHRFLVGAGEGSEEKVVVWRGNCAVLVISPAITPPPINISQLTGGQRCNLFLVAGGLLTDGFSEKSQICSGFAVVVGVVYFQLLFVVPPLVLLFMRRRLYFKIVAVEAGGKVLFSERPC